MTELPNALAGPLFERVPAESRAVLIRMLGAIAPDHDGPSRAFFGKPSWKVPLEWGNPVSPWEVQFVLKDIVGCDNFGRTEKLAWEYALMFEGVPMTLAFQKFGMRVYVDKDGIDEGSAAGLAKRVALTIGRALPLLQKTVLSEIADDQIARGEVNIDNHFQRLRRQYEHFRDLSKASVLAAGTAAPIREEHPGPPPSISMRYPAFELEQQGRFEANAALNAFFSMLEHLLLIEFLLAGRDAAGGRLASFIASGWSVKFKDVVTLSDSDAKAQYDRLREVHDQVRNRSVHGEVHSDGTDFKFLLPGIGPVSAHLVTSDGQRAYRWSYTSASSVLDVLEVVWSWIESGPLNAAVTYGESRLPLFFGDGLRDQLVVSRQDLSAFLELIDRIGMMADGAANMDW